MIEFLIFILPICFSQDYPETKPLRGGVFTWPHALSLSRKMWKWLKMPMLSFNFTDINLTQITEQYITNNLDFNVNEEIKSMLSELNDTTIQNSHIKNNKKLSKSYTKCNSNEYPNVYLILGGDPGYYECQTVEDTLGQIFSYLLMIMPLFVLTMIGLIFYLIFSIGRCFIFKPSFRNQPKIFEIISFSIISAILIYSILINFSGSVYFVSNVKYLLSKGVEKDFTTIFQSLNTTMKTAVKDMIEKVDPILDEIIQKVTDYVNASVPVFFDLINKTVDELNVYVDEFKSIENFGEKYNVSIQKVEKSYELCASSSADSSTCPNESSLLKSINFTGGFQVMQDYKEDAAFFVQIINVPDYIEEARQDLIESIENMKSDLLKEIDPDNLDLDYNFDEYGPLDVPSFAVPLMTFVLVLVPIVMLATFVAQVYSFWFPGKFSRACSFLCVPCSFWILLHFVIGSVGTILSSFVIFYGIVQISGDDAIDAVLKKVTNDDRTIHFGRISMLSATEDVVGSFYVDDIKLQRLEIIKNLLDAKVETALSDVMDIDKLPLDEVASVIQKTTKNFSAAFKLNEYVIWDLVVEVDNLLKAAPPSDLSSIVSIYDLRDKLKSFQNSVTCCNDEKARLSDEYNSFINEFFDLVSNYSKSFQTFKSQVRNIPDVICGVGTELLIGLLEMAGPVLAKAIRDISPILGSFDMSWLIGSVNIIRSRFLHQFLLGCIYLSISAHLYVISMVIMSMILWYRRRGMGDVGSELIESGSGSVFSNLIT